MVNPIPDSVRKIWDEWNIRGVILFSLSLQTVLISLAPLRKSTGNKLLVSVIWSAYLLADGVAYFGVGLITQRARDVPDGPDRSSKQPAESNELLAFWAPFLLLHLGGPDTITAFALEDNELWPSVDKFRDSTLRELVKHYQKCDIVIKKDTDYLEGLSSVISVQKMPWE